MKYRKKRTVVIFLMLTLLAAIFACDNSISFESMNNRQGQLPALDSLLVKTEVKNDIPEPPESHTITSIDTEHSLDDYYPNWQSESYIGISLPGWWRPFSESSLWNMPIADNPELNSYSDQIIENIKNTHGVLNINNRHWTTPVHVVNSDNIIGEYSKCFNGIYHESVDTNQDGVSDGPIPFVNEMWADPSNDAHMIIVDPFKGISWEFSRFRHKFVYTQWESSTHAQWNLSEQGMSEPFSGASWWRQGCRGSGIPLIAGLVRPEEIEAGEIKHALVFATGINAINIDGSGNKQLVRPASRTDADAKKSGPNYPLEGARIQLDPELDLDQLGLCKNTKVIARALQRYGAINSDNSSAFVLYLQPLDPDKNISGEKWELRFPGMRNEIQKIPISAFRVIKYGEIYINN